MPNTMWRRCGRYLLIFLLLFATVSCVGGGYVHKSRRARSAFHRGNYDKALAWYQEQNTPKKDQLLYLLDQGVILNAAGRYQESIAVFEQAIELSDARQGAQVGSQTASMVSNDNYIPYQGHDFERLLMTVYQILNYIGLEDYRGALVEVRSLHNRYGDFFKAGQKDYLSNAFATYLAGLVWDTNGNLNDAYIDYKKTFEINGSFAALEQDLLNGAWRLGFLDEYRGWRKKFEQSKRPLEPGYGEVILILNTGEVPRRRSTEERHSLQFIPIPYYPDTGGPVATVTVRVNGETRGETVPLYRVDQAAAKALAADKPAIITRALARLVAKEGAAVAIGKEVDEDLGILFGILVLSTNRADLRSWLTLPRAFQVSKFSLPAGVYDLELRWSGGRHIIKGVEVEARTQRYVLQRLF